MKKTYTYDEVKNASTEYFKGDSLAAEVFAGKYALRDQDGNILELTPLDMHRRLAREFARIEQKYPNPLSEEMIEGLLASWTVVPQGSPMSGIGNPYQVQSLSNCFVIEPPHDSYGGIMKTDQEQAQIMKRRGGVGFDISRIRPRGLRTANAARTTDGIGVFMERFSNTCREVAQGGRRGALMLSISCHHPDIRTFINIKRDLTKVTGANVSVKLSDEFMNAVASDSTVELRFPVEQNSARVVSENVDAKTLWNEIITSAHATGEPGLLFWDTMIRNSPADSYASLGFATSSTNPCAELPLPPGDSCRLTLVNVTKFVVDQFEQYSSFSYDAFGKAVEHAQRLMDDLIDLELEVIEKIIAKIESDPEPEVIKATELDLWKRIHTKCVEGRRTGLGITGLGDAIAMLGMRYGSDESIKFTDNVYNILCTRAYHSSVNLANERGAFPIYDKNLEKGNEFLQRLFESDRKLGSYHNEYGRRNIALLTTAPAGSVSIMTQTTSGCEPAYMLSYKRRRKINPDDLQASVDYVDALGDKWQEYTVYHHGFKKWMDLTGKSNVSESPYHLSTSNEIDWESKIDLQAAAQKWVDHAISNTVNLPKTATVEDVKRVYERAWKTGCKGVTVYREGSRSGVLVNAEEQKKDTQQIKETHAPKRPKELECDIHRVTVKGQSYLVLVGLLDGKPYEIFAGLQEHVEVPKKAKTGTLIKNGKNKDGVVTYNLKIPYGDDDELIFKDIVNLFDDPMYGALTRMLSLSLRHGVPLQYVADQLRKDKHSDITSFSSCIARVIQKNYVPDEDVKGTCSVCSGTNLQYVQGCVTCNDCGASKCG